MAKIDLEQERQRLIEFYSRQMDGELEKVADQAYDLTDIARDALRSELARRGLDTELAERAPVVSAPPALAGDPPPPEPLPVDSSSPDDEFELREMVTIRKFRDLPEALLAKGSLESAGIEVVLGDDNTVRMDWLWSNGVGGIKLKVSRDEVEAANEILEQPIPEGFEVAGIGEYSQPRCPKCQSLDIAFQELDPAAYLTLAVNIPVPFHRSAWRCHSCLAEWENETISERPESTP